MLSKAAVIVFLDGVGLGEPDPETNPFMQVPLELGRRLFDQPYFTRQAAGAVTDRGALLGLDAQLGVAGLPQSGTGQTSILTGHNAPAHLGKHYGPYPTQALRQLLADDSLFQAVLAQGGRAAYANAYPERFLDRLRRGKGRLSANTTAAHLAGLKIRGPQDLQRGRAIPALLSNEGWPEPEVSLPPLTAYQAGGQLAALSQDYTLTFFEFWYSDLLGHKMARERSVEILRRLDQFFIGLLDRLDLVHSLLLVVSDHGNFEDWTHSKHTHNPALGLVTGAQFQQIAPQLQALTDIKPAVLSFLAL